MSLSAITPITSSSDASSALLSLSPAASVSSSAQSSVSSLELTESTAAAIRATVSIPSSASSVTPPLSTDTLQLLQDLSTGNFSAAKSDVAKVQLDKLALRSTQLFRYRWKEEHILRRPLWQIL